MNAKLLTVTFSSVGLLLALPSMGKAQGATATTNPASTEASDRQFLQNLEQGDTTQKPVAPKTVEVPDMSPVPLQNPTREAPVPAPVAKARPAHKTPPAVVPPQGQASAPKVHQKIRRLTSSDEPAEVAAEEPIPTVAENVPVQSRDTATVQKSRDKVQVQRVHHAESSQVTEVAAEPAPTVTETRTVVTTVPVEEEHHRPHNDQFLNGFFHRLFHHDRDE